MTMPTQPIIHVVGAAILEDGRCLAVRRGPTMAMAGKWEFPGGKIEPGETPAQALQREITEELGITIEVGAYLGQGRAGDETEVRLDVYCAERIAGEVELREHSEQR